MFGKIAKMALRGAAYGGVTGGMTNGYEGVLAGAAFGGVSGGLMGKFAGRMNRSMINKLNRPGRGGLYSMGASRAMKSTGKILSSKGIGRGTVGSQSLTALGIGSTIYIGNSIISANKKY